MNIFGNEDGPQYRGNQNLGAQNDMQELESKKSLYMKHFMIDYIEHGLRKVVQQNSLDCAKNVGYFKNMSETLSPQN